MEILQEDLHLLRQQLVQSTSISSKKGLQSLHIAELYAQSLFLDLEKVSQDQRIKMRNQALISHLRSTLRELQDTAANKKELSPTEIHDLLLGDDHFIDVEKLAGFETLMGKGNNSSSRSLSNDAVLLPFSKTRSLLDIFETTGEHPIDIFSFVAHEIELDPSFGSKRSSRTTYNHRIGTSADQSALLIELLRNRGFAARFVHGEILLPLEKLPTLFGVHTTTSAIEVLAAGKIPYQWVGVDKIQLEHIWVEAYLPFGNYRGTQASSADRAWIPLDPSFSSMAIEPSNILPRNYSFDHDALLASFLQTAIGTNPLDWVSEEISQLLGTYSEEDLAVTFHLDGQKLRLLNLELPYKVEERHSVYFDLPDSLMQQVGFLLSWNGQEIMNVQIPATNVVGKKVMLYFEPYRQSDQDLVEQYGHIFEVPAHLIQVYPVLLTEDAVLARGELPLPMGHPLDLELNLPHQVLPFKSTVTSGGFSGFVFDAGQALVQVATSTESNPSLVSDIFHDLGFSFHVDYWKAARQFARMFHIKPVQPGLAVAKMDLDFTIEAITGVPVHLEVKGILMDAPLRHLHALSLNEEDSKPLMFQQFLNIEASECEASVYDNYEWDAMSTSRAFQLAFQLGIPYTELITQNIDELLPGLNISDDEETHIRDLIFQGLRVWILNQDLVQGTWSGRAYFAFNDVKGTFGSYLTQAIAGASSTAVIDPTIFDGVINPVPDFFWDGIDSTRQPAFMRLDPELQYTEVVVGEKAPFDFPVYLFDRNRQLLHARLKQVYLNGYGRSVELPRGQDEAIHVDYTASTTTFVYPMSKIVDAPVSNPSPLQVGHEQIILTTYGDFIGLYETLVLPGEQNKLEPGIHLSSDIPYPPGWRTTWSAFVEDSYGNPLANVPVQFYDLTGTYCIGTQFREDPSFGWSNIATSATDTTGEAHVYVRLGMQFVSPFQYGVSAGDFSYEMAYRTGTLAVGAGGGEYIWFRYEFNPEQKLPLVGSTPSDSGFFRYVIQPGQSLSYEFNPLFLESEGSDREPSCIFFTEYPYEQVGVMTTRPDISSITQLGGNFFQLDVFDPGSFEIIHTFEYGKDEKLGKTGQARITIESPKLTLVVPPLKVDGQGRALENLTAEIKIEGSNFVWPLMAFNLRKNGTSIHTRNIFDVSAPGKVVGFLGVGTIFDLNSTYTIEFVNETDPLKPQFNVPLVQLEFEEGSFILKGNVLDKYNKPQGQNGFVSLEQVNMDCMLPAVLRLDLTNDQPMAVTGWIGQNLLFQDRIMVPGQNMVNYDIAELGVGIHEYRFEALDGRGNIQSAKGEISVVAQLEDNLPVGHTIIKGVDLNEGSLSIQRRDIDIGGRGAGLSFSRTYSTKSAGMDNHMGCGWRHNWESKVILACDQSVRITGGDGSGQNYHKIGDEYIPQRGYHGTLEGNGIDGFDFYTKSRNRYHYNGAFPVESESSGDVPSFALMFIEGTFGNRISLFYNTGVLEKVFEGSDPMLGRFILFTYQFQDPARPRISQVSGSEGSIVAFEYNEDGQLLVATKNPEGLKQQVEIYVYTSLNIDSIDYEQLVTQPGSVGIWFMGNQLTSVTNPNGQTTYYEYFSEAEETGSLSPGVIIGQQLSYWEYVKKVIEPEGYITTFGYAPFTQAIVEQSTMNGSTTTRYEFNQYGSPILIESPLGIKEMGWALDDVTMLWEINELGQSLDYTYDENANMLSKVITKGILTLSEESWTYDSLFNKPLTSTDPNGNLTIWALNQSTGAVEIMSQVISEVQEALTTYTYSANGDLLSMLNPRGFITSFTFDDHGFPKTKTTPDLNVTTTTYDLRGRLLEQSNLTGLTTTFEYNELNQLTHETTTALQSGGREVQYNDILAMGQVQTIIDGKTSKTLSYDSLNRVIGESIFTLVNPDTALSRRDRIHYDVHGNITQETLSNAEYSHTINRVFDGVGRLTVESVDNQIIKTLTYLPGTTLPTTVANWHGAVTQLEYDGLLHLKKTIMSTGHVNQYLHDALGNKLWETSANDNLTQYEYDSLNRLVLKTNALGHETHFTYDFVGNLIRTHNTTTQAEAIFSYDGMNRVVSQTALNSPVNQTTLFSYPQFGRVKTTTPPEDAAITETFNEMGQLIQTEQNGIKTLFYYDGNGNQLWVNHPAPYANETFTYDAMNRTISHTDVEGYTESFVYDPFGNVLEHIDFIGTSTVTTYDYLSRPLLVSVSKNGRGSYQISNRYSGTPSKVETTYTTPLGNQIIEVTDSRGRLTEVRDRVRGTLKQVWDGENLVKVTNYRGIITNLLFDDLNRVTTETTRRRSVKTIYDDTNREVRTIDPRGILQVERRDLAGNILQRERAGIVFETNLVDRQNRLISQQDGEGNTRTWTFNDNGWLTQLTVGNLATSYSDFTALGYPQHQEDGVTFSTSQYDFYGRVLVSTNALDEEIYFSYDGMGQLLTKAIPTSTGPQTTSYAYDVRNQLTSVIEPLGVSTYIWTSNWLECLILDPDEVETYLTYDAAGRMTELEVTDMAPSTYQYDGQDNLISMSNGSGSATYTYDEFNLLINEYYLTDNQGIRSVSRTRDPNGNLLTVLHQDDLDEKYARSITYDDFDRPTNLGDNRGFHIQFGYLNNGLREYVEDANGARTEYTYLSNGLLNTVQIWDKSPAQYSWTPNGRLAQLDYPNGAQSQWTYDAANRIESLTHLQDLVETATFNYTYFTGGERQSLEELRSGHGSWFTAYAYDEHSRLTNWTRTFPGSSQREVSYELSPGGDRLTETELETGTSPAFIRTRTYLPTPNHQVVGFEEEITEAGLVISHREVNYSYDNEGNRTEKRTRNLLTQTTDTTGMTWDARNRLLSVFQNGSIAQHFTYDDLDRRIRKEGDERGTSPVLYVWDELSVLNEFWETSGSSKSKQIQASSMDDFLPKTFSRVVSHPRIISPVEPVPPWQGNPRIPVHSIDESFSGHSSEQDISKIDSSETTRIEGSQRHQTIGPRTKEQLRDHMTHVWLKAQESKSNIGLCITWNSVNFLLNPEVTEEELSQFLIDLPPPTNKTATNGRWQQTATDGPVDGFDSFTLTYSFVLDGTPTPSSYIGESEDPSSLYTTMDSQFPGGMDGFKVKVQQTLNAWSVLTGIQYVEVLDDGAAFPDAAGLLAVQGVIGRGDIRIAMHSIDTGSGATNILAYNFFPVSGGDMVLDQNDLELFSQTEGDFLALRNIFAHEHGHGLGLVHVDPLDESKLMESLFSTSFDGPQEDDTRQVQSVYGDAKELNDDLLGAYHVGLLPEPQGGQAVFVNADLLALETLGASDTFRFEVPGNAYLHVNLEPLGTTYWVANEGLPVQTRYGKNIHNLRLELMDQQGRLIHFLDEEGIGIAETLEGFPLPMGAGTYYLRVTSTSNNLDVQQYQLELGYHQEDGPELRLHYQEDDLVDGSILILPTTQVGELQDLVLTIENLGDQTLSLSLLTIESGDLTDFEIFQPSQSNLEPEESTTFTLRYQPIVNGQRNVTVLIQSNDPDEGEIRFEATGNDGRGPPEVYLNTLESEVSETDKTASIPVVLRTSDGQPITVPVQVTYTTEDLTAMAGQDYTPVQDQVLFPVGTESGAVQMVSVPILVDLEQEPSEFFKLRLIQAEGGMLGQQRNHTIQITGDEGLITVSVEDVRVIEMDVNTTLTFPVTLSAPTAQEVQVEYTTISGTAISGSDFETSSGTLTFPAGITYLEVDVLIIPDNEFEPEESFTLNLSNPTEAFLGLAVASATIVDDDTTGTLESKASYAFGNMRLAMQGPDQVTAWIQTNSMGSTTDLTDDLGTVLQTLTYDPFGKQETIFGSSWNRYTFTGHEWDPETELYYAKARFYDPDLGNFTSLDKWQFVQLNNAPTLNRYQYAFGNPLRYSDPTGDESVDETLEDKEMELIEDGRMWAAGGVTFGRFLWQAIGAESISKVTDRIVTGNTEDLGAMDIIGAGLEAIPALGKLKQLAGVGVKVAGAGILTSFSGGKKAVSTIVKYADNVGSKLDDVAKVIKEGSSALKQKAVSVVKKATPSKVRTLVSSAKTKAVAFGNKTKQVLSAEIKLKPKIKQKQLVESISEGTKKITTKSSRNIKSVAPNKGSVWNKVDTQRGIDIENALAKTDYKDWFNAGKLHKGYFPLIDFQKGKNLVSLKTVNTKGKTWMGRMEEHISDLGSRGAKVDGQKANMTLDIRVQPGGASDARSLIKYGRENNVTVIIKEYN